MFGPSLTAAAVVTALGLAATADTAAPNEERLGGYIGIYDDIGPGYCTKTGGPRVQTVLCDSSSAAGKGKCAYTQESCAALCTADSHCTGYMTQDMSQYQEPPTCVLVTPNAPSGPQWVVQNSGGGFSIGEHDGETRDHCYRKSSAPAPPSPTPGPPAPGGGCFQEIGNGYCVKTSGGSNRCQNYFCDDSSLHPDTCPKTQAACAALCAADSKCSGYVLQDMSMYNVPNTCALVTPTKPAAVLGTGSWRIVVVGLRLADTTRSSVTPATRRPHQGHRARQALHPAPLLLHHRHHHRGRHHHRRGHRQASTRGSRRRCCRGRKEGTTTSRCSCTAGRSWRRATRSQT